MHIFYTFLKFNISKSGSFYGIEIVINVVETVQFHLVNWFCIEELHEDIYKRANFCEDILFLIDPCY